MSGKPYPKAVETVIVLMDKISQLGAETRTLRAQITNNTSRLKEAEEELADAWRGHQKLMEDMDLSQEGNFGFEQRATWFLAELRRQVEEAERSGQKEGE